MALVLPLAAACTSGDGEDDADDVVDTAATEVTDVAETPDVDISETGDDETPTAESDTTPETEMTSTPESEETPDADMTGTPESDETPDADMTGTPDTDMDSTPDTDATGTPDVDSTPGTGDMVDDPFEDVGELQSDVPNFTLDFTGSFENVPDDTGEIFSADIDMMLMQSEPDIYQLSFTTTGDDAVELEVWSLADSTFIAESGGMPVELPAGIASEFAPTNALVVVPPVATLAVAEEVGADEVDGRDATQYRVEAEDAAVILAPQGAEINDPEGEMEIWIDDELGVVLQMVADVTWTNEDDTEAMVVIDYTVSDVGETDDIEAPDA